MAQMNTTQKDNKINQQQEMERLEIESRMNQIKQKILVFSGPKITRIHKRHWPSVMQSNHCFACQR